MIALSVSTPAITDLGAIRHIPNYKKAFTSLQQIIPKYIKLGDGEVVIYTQIGIAP